MEALHPTISRQHMMVVVDRALGPFVVDLNSSNGTFINGTKLLPYKFYSYPVNCSSIITLGVSTRTYMLKINTCADVIRKKELLAKIEEESTKDVTGKDSENTVFVGNISFDASERQVSDFFSTCGPILRLSMPKDRDNGFTHKGIAFITFSQYNSVAKALMKDGEELQGRCMKVKRSGDTSRAKTGSGSHRTDSAKTYSDDPKYGRPLDSSSITGRRTIDSSVQESDNVYKSHGREYREDYRDQVHSRDRDVVDRQKRKNDSDIRDSSRHDRGDRERSSDRDRSDVGRNKKRDRDDSPHRGRRI